MSERPILNLHAAMKLRFARSALRSLRDIRSRIGLDPLATSAEEVAALAREWEAMADRIEQAESRRRGLEALHFRIRAIGR